MCAISTNWPFLWKDGSDGYQILGDGGEPSEWDLVILGGRKSILVLFR